MTTDSIEIPTIKANIKAGQKWHRAGIVLNANEELADLSTMTAKMEFREHKSQKLLATLTEQDGINLLDASGDNNYEIELSSTNTMKFNHHELVLADLFIINGSVAHPIINLQLRVQRTITQWQTN